MAELFYNIVILAFGILGVLKGFRCGLTGQVSNVLGFAFGAVCAHAFVEDGERVLREWIPSIASMVGGQYIYSIISAAIIYIGVYYLFSSLTRVLKGAMVVFRVGMLDSLLGALFGCLKYLIAVSLIFNVIACFKSDSVLVKSSTASDGNLIEGVVALAPWVLGSLSLDEYAHLIQLHEARKISMDKTINSPNAFNFVVQLAPPESKFS